MEEEEEVCRVCRSGEEPGNALYHPCKCSGSIRYVHQDCLMTWLQSSKRKYCELCGHPFQFTKVYDPHMPSSLPPHVLFVRVLKELFSASLIVLRTIAVSVTWLGLVPWCTIWVVRLHFFVGHGLARSLAGESFSLNATVANSESTSPEANLPSLHPLNAILLLHPTTAALLAKPTWFDLLSDIFEGQIITASIVVLFLVAFLMKEWVVQIAEQPFDEAAQQNPPGALRDQEVMREIARAAAQREIQQRLRDHQQQPARANIMADNPAAEVLAEADAADPTGTQHEELQERPDGQSMEEEDDQKSQDSEESEWDWEGRPTPEQLRALRMRYLDPIKLAAAAAADAQEVPVRAEPSTSINSDAMLDLGFSQDGTSEPSQSSSVLQHPSPPTAAPSSFSHHPSAAELPLPPSVPSTPPHMPTEHPEEPEGDSPIFSLSSIHTFSNPNHAPSSPPLDVEESSFANPTALVEPSTQNSHASEIDEGKKRSQDSFIWDGAKWPSEPQDGEEQHGESSAHIPSHQDEGHNENSSEDNNKIQDPVEKEHTEEEWVDETDEEQEAVGAREEQEEEVEIRLDVHRVADLIRQQRQAGNDDMEDIAQRVGLRMQGQPGLVRRVRANDLREGDEEEEEEEEEEVNDRLLDEDLEGLMEAVGLRGPFMTLIQNSALIIILLSFFIHVAIFIPFTTGRTFLLLDFLSVFRSLLYPIRLVRIITDPAVKPIIAVGSKHVSPIFSRVFSPIIRTFSASRSTRQSSTLVLQSSSLSAKLSSLSLLKSLDSALESFLASPSSSEEVLPMSRRKIVELSRPYIKSCLLFFRQLGSSTRAIYITSRTFISTLPQRKSLGFAALAGEDKVGDRVLATAVGYGCIILGLIFFLKSQSTRTGWRKWFKDGLLQNIVVIKLAFFMAIELVIFPLGCGILLDLCLLPLFSSDAFSLRLDFMISAPFIGTFLHWVGGTLFMFGFASMLSYCRQKVRKGVFYFIRDPSDPAFQPVREIISRSTSSQLVKLGISAMMYGFIITSSVGVVLGVIRLIARGVLPLIWIPTQPLSQIPVDLLFMLICLPTWTRKIAPQRRITASLFAWWTFSIKALRLQSYFFGPPLTTIGADVDDQIDTRERRWLDSIALRMGGEDFQKGAGGLARVPHSDQLSIIPRMRMLVLLNEFHAPIDQTEMELLIAQNKKAVSVGRRPDQDFCVCYLPPRLRNRIILLTFSFWLSLVALAAFGLALPIFIGRFIFSLFGFPLVHDGYSLILGALPSYSIFLTLDWSVRLVLAKQSPMRTLARGLTDVKTTLQRKVYWIALLSYIYVIGAVGSIVPLAVGLVIELYCIMPLKVSSAEPPIIRIPEVWAMGVLWIYLAYRLQNYIPARYRERTIRPLETFLSMSAKEATIKLILPTLIGLFVLTVVPFVLALCLAPFLQNPTVLFRGIYLEVLAVVTLFATMGDVRQLINRWVNMLREQEYLVGVRLSNVDDKPDKKVVAKKPATGAVDGNVVAEGTGAE
ncbi:Protein involved in mRNA turnover and stability [Phaffia rhodozyma]|uniref:RING-type E3 ubiquitin transferase n=1 Tax=Phaffia rhodozyma TaxID=264483 RepID=A0A0F7SMH7_PHARH|nr:Protein involved in mRNA turnover and stability [Phaffia rhodozyma]